ncbi:acyl-CoA dehydrogenase family protein, partial [Pseudoalteromonas sp. SIMBA_153]
PIKTLDGGHDVNEVFFDDVWVPRDNLVGEEHKGWGIAKYLLGHERTNIAGLGNCKRFMRRLREIAASSQKKGRPLLEDVRFRDKVAAIEMELHAHEWSLLRLIDQEGKGQGKGIEA